MFQMVRHTLKILQHMLAHAASCSILSPLISYQATINWHVTIPMEKID